MKDNNLQAWIQRHTDRQATYRQAQLVAFAQGYEWQKPVNRYRGVLFFRSNRG